MALQCIKQKLTELPGEIHKSAFVVELFHLRISSVIGIIKQTKKDIGDLKNKFDLIDILTLITGQCAFFSNRDGIFSKTDSNVSP